MQCKSLLLVVSIMLGVVLLSSLSFASPTINNVSTASGNTQNKQVLAIYNISDNGQGINNIKLALTSPTGQTNYTLQDPTCIAHWGMNNFSAIGDNGTWFRDTCSYANNITFANASVTSNGKYFGGLIYDGLSTRTSIPSSSTLSSNTTFRNLTVSVWINRSTFPTGGSARIIEKGVGFDGGWAMIQSGTSSNIIFVMYNTTGNCQADSGSAIPINTWTNLVGVYNGTAVALYVNGALGTVATCANGLNNMYLNTTGSVLIGYKSGNSNYFNGTIDEVEIYNRSWSASEILFRYRNNVSTTRMGNTNWTTQFSFNINNSGLNSTVQNESYSYFLCADNYSSSLTCSNNLSLTRIITQNNLNTTYTQSLGVIRNDFYGTSFKYLNFIGATQSIDCTGTGVLNCTSNLAYERQAFSDSKMNFIRKDMELGAYYQNTSNITGVSRTGNLTNVAALVNYSQSQGIKVLFIADFMPTWLADNSTGLCSNLNYCPATNASKFGNIVVDFLSRVGCTPSTCEVEVWNEPYGGFWMGVLGDDNVGKATNYTAFYNATYTVIKANNASWQVGGPAGFRLAPTMTTYFIANESGYFDFISIHPYGYTWNNELNQLVDITAIYSQCATLGVTCNRVIASEWNIGNATLENNTAFSNKYGSNYLTSYISILNKYPANVSLMTHLWGDVYKYGAYYPDYPYLYSMTSEPTLDNQYYPTYNVTKNLARYCPSGATVYNISSDSSQIYTSACNNTLVSSIIFTNNDTEARNVTVNASCKGGFCIDPLTGVLYNTTNPINYGIMDSYAIQYLTNPIFYSVKEGVGTNITNYLNESIITTQNMAFNGTSTNGNKVIYYIGNNLTAQTMKVITTSVDCNTVSAISYTPQGAGATLFTDQAARTVCNQLQSTSGYSLLVNPGSDNELMFTLGCTQTTQVGYSLIMIIAAILIISYLAFNIYNNGLEAITWQKMIVIGIIVILAVIFWSVSGSNLTNSCPVG